MAKSNKKLEGKKRSLANLQPAQKGEVRNPYGRPKKEHTFSDTARELLSAEELCIEITLTDGKKKRIELKSTKNFHYGLVAALIVEGLKGNVQAIRELVDRVEGKAAQNLQISGSNEVQEMITRIITKKEFENKRNK